MAVRHPPIGSVSAEASSYLLEVKLDVTPEFQKPASDKGVFYRVIVEVGEDTWSPMSMKYDTLMSAVSYAKTLVGKPNMPAAENLRISRYVTPKAWPGSMPEGGLRVVTEFTATGEPIWHDPDWLAYQQKGPVTEAADWTTLRPVGELDKDLLSFYELEYKYSKIAYAPEGPRQAYGVVNMLPRRRDAILSRMGRQAKALGVAIAEEALPTFDSWIRAHDLENLDVMGAERVKKIQRRFHAKGKTGDINDWVLKRHTTRKSMSVVTGDEWLRAIEGDEAPALRLALELLHEQEYADKGSFEEFVKKVVARDPIGTMRRAIKHVDEDDRDAVVLQMFQKVYPIGYRKRLGDTSQRVGKNIIAAQLILEKAHSGDIDAPEIFAKINWALNVVHQAGKMANHVANDMGISVEYLDKLSNLDTSAWDAELKAMSTPRESVTEAEDLSFNGWYDTRAGEFHKVTPSTNAHAEFAMSMMPSGTYEEAWDMMFEKGFVRLIRERTDELGIELDYEVTSVRTVQKILEQVPPGVEDVVVDFRRNGQLVASASVPIDELLDATSWVHIIAGAGKGSSFYERIDVDSADATRYIIEGVAQGEWWIDDSGYAQYADGDVGERGHTVLAMETMLADVDFDVDDPDAPEIFPMEPLSDEAIAYLKERDVDPKVLKFLEEGGDPREWMVEHRGWIRLIGSGAELWRWDKNTLDLLREGVFDAWGLDTEEIGEDDYVMVEEAVTRDLFRVPLNALMNERYDAKSLRRLAAGEPYMGIGSTSMNTFARAAWARKAAGELGIGEAVDDGLDDWDDDLGTGPIDWDAEIERMVRKYKPKKMSWRSKHGFHPTWEIPKKLARSSRPGYPTRKTVPLKTVDEWIAGAKKAGIKSILLLLGPDQLHMYKDVPGGLPNYYRKNGFKVAHVPTIDKHRVFINAKLKAPKGMKWLSQSKLNKAYAAYKKLPKPVLVHCSAGIDRSGAVVSHIKNREGYKDKDKGQKGWNWTSEGLVMSSAGASSYLMEALGSFDYKVPDDKETQLYDFYMMTYLPDPDRLMDVHGWAVGMSSSDIKAREASGNVPVGARYRQPRPDLGMAVDDTRKKLVPYLKSNLLNAAFYSIACEVRYIFKMTGGDTESIIKDALNGVQVQPILQSYDFGPEMAVRIRNYRKEYEHLKKYPVPSGQSFEAPGVDPTVLSSQTDQSDRDASYRAALLAFEGHIEEFIRFASWGFWDRKWSGFNKKNFVKAMKDYDKPGMKAASGSYGGGNWGMICDGWGRLFGSSKLTDDIVRVDNLYSLQHNTGAVLNKVQSYAKNGRFTWIDRALSKKFGAESPYEFVGKISSDMRRLAMPVIKDYYDTTLEQWAKDNPTKATAEATKSGVTGGVGDGTKKDYVYTKNYKTAASMKKSLLKWYKGVTRDNVDDIFNAAVLKHGLDTMKSWQFPSYAAAITKTAAMSSPPLLQGNNASLVVVLNGVLDTTEKHKYFDKKKPGVAWMSAKHLGITPALTHFRKETAAPTKKAAAPQKPVKVSMKKKKQPSIQSPSSSVADAIGLPSPSGPPVDLAGIYPAIDELVASKTDEVFVEVFQPKDVGNAKIAAIKGIRNTYDMGLKNAKGVVDHAHTNKIAPKDTTIDNGYLMFWWPKGNFVTMGPTFTDHPQAKWGEAEVAFATRELIGSGGHWTFAQSDGPIKMIMVNNRWYVPALDVMSSSMVEDKTTSAPQFGTHMTRVVKLPGDKEAMLDVLVNTFKADHDAAKVAIDSIPTNKLKELAWVDYSKGTIGYEPNEFGDHQSVNVAIWSDKAKAIVPIRMSAWRVTGYDNQYEYYVMNNTIKAAKVEVPKAPAVKLDVHEGTMMYTVHDHGVGDATLAGPFTGVAEVANAAAEKKKDYPKVGINEYIFLDGVWELLREYDPSWHLIATNDAAFAKVKAKTETQPAVKPVLATKVQPPKPEDIGVYFRIAVVSPDKDGMSYPFNNKFISWAQVEKGIAALQNPESGIKGAPFKYIDIKVEKLATSKMIPELSSPKVVETMSIAPSSSEGHYNAMVTYENADWADVPDKFKGSLPETRDQAIKLAEPDRVERVSVDNPVVTFVMKAKGAHSGGKYLAVFANAFVHWGQVKQALKAMKDPDSGISGVPIEDDLTMVEKWAHPIAWPPGIDVSKFGANTSSVMKVEELNTDGETLWAHEAWSEVVDEMKEQGKPWNLGGMPGTREGAAAWSKIAVALQDADQAVGFMYPKSWTWEPTKGSVEFYVAAVKGGLGSGTLLITPSFAEAVANASDCAGLWKKAGGLLSGGAEAECFITARVTHDAWPDWLQKKYPPPAKYSVEKFDADGKHTEWMNPDWQKVQVYETGLVNYDKMTVLQVSDSLDLKQDTQAELEAQSSDSLLSEVWSDLTLDAQTDIQLAIGAKSSEALDDRKSADIYKVYPTESDDVRYMVQVGIKSGGEKFPGGKTPDSAMKMAEFKAKSYSGVITIIKQVDVGKGKFVNLHMFEADGRLTASDKSILNPNVSVNKHTGLRKGVPYSFMFVEENGEFEDLGNVPFEEALQEANVMESELRGDDYGYMILTVGKDVFFKVTGHTTVSDNIRVVEYGLPEGYIKNVTYEWSNATGLKGKAPFEKSVDIGDAEIFPDEVILSDVMDAWPLSDEAQEDLSLGFSTNPDQQLSGVWDEISDHTKTELRNIWNRAKRKAEPSLEKKPWNAWMVVQTYQLPISDEAKAELNKFGGGMVLGEVMGKLPDKIQKELLNAIENWLGAWEQPEEKPKKPDGETGEPNLDTDVLGFTFIQVQEFLEVPQETLGKIMELKNQASLDFSDNLESIWLQLNSEEREDVVTAHHEWVIEKQKVPQEKPEASGARELTIKDDKILNMTQSKAIATLDLEKSTVNELNATMLAFQGLNKAWHALSDNAKVDILKKWEESQKKEPTKKPVKKKPVKKKKALKKPDTKVAMKAMQSWTVADAIKYLNLHILSVHDLEKHSSGYQKPMVISMWSLLKKSTQDDLIQSWKKHKVKKQSEPKKSKKPSATKKVLSPTQAMKNVKTWKINSVLGFLDPSVHDAVTAAIDVTGVTGSSDVSSIWSALTVTAKNNLVDAYIQFMKIKHGLESVSADASCYLLEAKKKTYPRITRRAYSGAEGSYEGHRLDLYFVRFREGEKEYCYALDRSLLGTIDKIESYSPAKAASIVKARSKGEYDCSTGKLKHLEPKPRRKKASKKVKPPPPPEEPGQVQTTLFDESAEASMYALEQHQVMMNPYGWVESDGTFHETYDHQEWINDRYSAPGSAPIAAWDDAMEDGWVRVSPSIIELGGEPNRDTFRKVQDLFSNHTADRELTVDFNDKWFRVLIGDFLSARSMADARRRSTTLEAVETAYRSVLARILEKADAAELVDVEPAQRGMLVQDKKALRELKDGKYPATSEKDKAFVFHWADGRGICAFKHKRDAIAWINDEENHLGGGPEIVKWWYGEPYTKQYDNRKKGKKKRKKLRVATSYKVKKKKTEAVTEGATYVGRCVELEGCDISEMVEGSTSISNRTFRRLIGSENYRWLEDMLGFDKYLRMANDWAISYAYGTYKGQPAVYADWSAIEHIFVLDQPVRVRKMRRAEAKEPTEREAELARSKEMWRPPIERVTHKFPHGWIIDGEFYDIGTDIHIMWAANKLGHIDGYFGPEELANSADKIWDEVRDLGWVRLTKDETVSGIGGVDFISPIESGRLRTVQKVLIDQNVKVKEIAVDAPKGFNVSVSYEDFMNARSPHQLKMSRLESVTEDVDRDEEATQMLARYGEEPTSIWLYTDMPVKDRVAWAYLAADRYMDTEGEDLVSRFMNTLRQVVDDPETFWEQIREKNAIRANYLDHLDWDIVTVSLEDVGVYPRFSGFSDEICQGNVIQTAAAIETTSELPAKVAKLREMSDVWTTVLKFLPPILVPGGILRSERPGYEVLKYTCDDGNHRLVSAAMAGATEAVCFVGKQKKEKIEPAKLVMAGSTGAGMVT